MVCKTRKVEAMLAAPNKDSLELVLKETNETEEKMRHNEQLILDWIKYQNHMPSNVDKALIRGFLRGCKHNIEKTKRKLELNFSARVMYPQLFSNRSPHSKEIQRAMDNTTICFLPHNNDRGERMAMFRADGPATEFDMIAACKLFFMTYDLCLTSKHPYTGEIAIFDVSGFTAGHLTKFVSGLRLLVANLREAYSIRLKRIHIINVVPAVERVITTLKPLLHKNIRNNFVLHPNKEDLGRYLGEEVTPLDYGGRLDCLRDLALSSYEVIKENADWFDKTEEMKLLGSIPKKYEANLYANEILGIEGSFRKLDID